MSYTSSPELAMDLAVPGSGQQFETVVFNQNLTKVDNRAASDRGRLETLEQNMIFAATATALAAITGTKQGEFARVTASMAVYRWAGSVWRLDNVPSVADAAARDALFVAPIVPAQGDTVYTADSGITWQYYALYNASTNPGGANPAGWYPVDGTVLAQATRFNTSTVITTTATAIGSLSAVGVAPGTPVSVEVHLTASNENSGADRSIWVQIFEDTTARGAERSFFLPYSVGTPVYATPFLAAVYTPASGLHTWTVKVRSSANSAVAVLEATLVVRSAVPRS